MASNSPPLPQLPREKLLKRFARNEHGRDFAVGDLHGMYSALETLLERVNFDPANDRLFSVGDLIDRGPESYRSLEFLAYEWFHAVQGNHERMLIEAVESPDDMDNWVNNNGGGWWHEIDEPTRHVFRKAIESLPIGIEIESDNGLVGIIHADVPTDTTWHGFFDQMEQDPYLLYYAVWSRNRLKRAELNGDVPAIDGVDLMVVGHTPLRKATQLRNIYYLDTAAAYSRDIDDAKLTLLQFHPRLQLTSLKTAEFADELVED